MQANPTSSLPALRVIPREAHSISRKNISPNALRVLYRLREAGFGAYLVGGAVRDLLIGNVDMMFDVAPALLPHLRSGEFRALAVGSAKRVAGVPELRDVPSMEELLPGSGIDAQAWYAVLTTAGTPQDRIDRLFAAFAGLVRSEAFRDRLVPEGLTPIWDDSPAAFGAYLQAQAEYWRKLVEASGATLD